MMRLRGVAHCKLDQSTIYIPPVEQSYTIGIEGSNTVARTPAGVLVNSGTDFGVVFNALNSSIQNSNNILLLDGTYLVNTRPYLTKSNIIFTGSSNSIIKGGVDYTQELFFEQGTYNTVQNIVFDDNNIGGYSAAYYIEGDHNLLSHCTLNNGYRYGFTFQSATNFTISDCIVNQAQYGISGSSLAQSITGLVTGNFLYNCRDCGIKIKAATSINFTNNYVDVGYVTWTTNSSGSGAEGCHGIRFYTGDDAVYNCVASGNTVTDSKQNRVTTGFTEDSDLRLDNPTAPASYGMEINNNTISYVYYGLLIKKAAEITYTGNSFTGVRNTNIAVWG